MFAIVSMYGQQMADFSSSKPTRAGVQPFKATNAPLQVCESSERTMEMELQQKIAEAIETAPSGPNRAPGANLLANGNFNGTSNTAASQLPAGWTRTGANVTGSSTPVFGAWTTGTSTTSHSGLTWAPRTGTRLAFTSAVGTTAVNAWLFTPAIAMTSGQTYMVSFWYQIPEVNAGGTPLPPNQFDVKIGSAAAEASMTETLFTTNTNIDGWTNVTIFYTATTTGNYFLGFNDRTPAASPYSGYAVLLDDIFVGAVNDNDLALTVAVSPQWPLQIPANFVMPLTGAVSNIGALAQTNITLSATLNGNPAGTSAPHASLAPGANVNLSVPAFNGVLGTNTLVYTVSQTQTDDDLNDNTVTLPNFTGTTNFMVVNGPITGGIGNTSPITMGNVYDITTATTLSQIVVGFSTSTTAANYDLEVYAVNGLTTAATPLVAIPDIARNTGGYTTVNLPTPLALTPGRYYVCLVQTGSANIGFGHDGNTTRSMYTGRANSNLFRQNSFGAGALQLIFVDATCTAPSALAAVSPDFNTITLTWEGTAPQYKVVINNGTADQVFTTWNKTLTINNLQPGTYTWAVEALCDATNTSVTPGTPFTPMACVAVSTFPYTQGFDATTFPPSACWANLSSNATASRWVRGTDAPLRPGSTAQARYPNTNNAAGQFSYLITEALAIPAIGVYALNFWDRFQYGEDGGTFGVWVSNTNNDPASFTLLSPVAIRGTGATRTPWQENAILLDAYAGQTIYLAFIVEATASGWTTSWEIDDMSVALVPANEMVVTAVAPFPFTQIPTTQSIVAPMSATVKNAGLNPQTNVTLGVALGATSIATSTPVASMVFGTSQTLTATPTAAPTAVIAPGTNTLNYTVSSDFYTGGTVLTATQTFEGTANEYSLDDPTRTTWGNVNGTNGTARGHVFTITDTTVLSGVKANFNATTGVPQIFLQAVTGTTLTGDVLINNVAFGTPTVGWNVHTLATPVVLEPGSYFLGIRQSTTATVALRHDSVAGRTFYTRTTGNLIVNTSAAVGMPCVRMIMADPCTAPDNMAAVGSRPQAKLEWSGTAPVYQVNVYDATTAVVYTTTTSATEIMVPGLLGNTTYTWNVTGVCAQMMTSATGTFTTDPDTVNFAMVAMTGIPSGQDTNLTTYYPTVQIQNLSNTGLGYSQIAFEIFVNGTSIGMDTTSTTNIAPGATQNYTSTLQVDLTAAGAFTVQAVITDTRDMIAADDTATISGTNNTIDIAVTGVVTPVTPIINATNAEVLTVQVTNMGSVTITDFALNVEIEGKTQAAIGFTATLDTTLTGLSIAAGATYNVVFQTTVDFSAFGAYDLIVTADLYNDGNLTNNVYEHGIISASDAGITDAMIVQFTAPNANLTAQTTPQNVTVEVMNAGTTSFNSLPVSLYVNGTLLVTDTVTSFAAGVDSMASGDVYFHTFSQQVDFTNSMVTSTTNLMAIAGLTGDEDASNDTARLAVTNTFIVDAQVVSVMTPTATATNMDSIPATIVVRNNGNMPLTSLVVNASVNYGTPVTTTIPSLAVGASETVILPVALVAGANAIRAYVNAVPNDTSAVNDTAVRNVTNNVVLGVQAWTVPAAQLTNASNAETVTITVENGGTFSVRNIPVELWVGGVLIATENIDRVARGATAATSRTTYTFNAKANLAAAGPHQVRVVIAFPGNTPTATNRADTTRTITNTIVTGAPIPYFEGFEATVDTVLPAGWTHSTATIAWKTLTSGQQAEGIEGGTPNARTGTRFLTKSWSRSGSFSWAFSEPIALTAGTTYTVSFWYQAPGYQGQTAERDLFKVQIGPSTARTGTNANATMTGGTTIFTQTATSVSVWTQATFQYTPTTTGLHYLGFHDQTPSGRGFVISIDDISITIPAANDLEVIAAALPYTQIPTSQNVFPANLTATVKNIGSAAQTNVKFSVAMNGTAVGTPSTPVDTLAPGATSAAMTVATGMTTVPLGNNTFVYTASSTETPAGSITATLNIMGTEGTFAVDNETTFALGIGSNDGALTFGNIFEIANATSALQIVVGHATATPLNYEVAIYAMTGSSGLAVAETPMYTQTTQRTAVGWNTVTLTTPQALAPGRYLIAVRQLTATNVSVAYVAGGVVYLHNGTTTLNNANAFTCAIRLVVGTPGEIPVELTSTTPANNATDVAVDAVVKATFNQNVTAGTLSGITFSPTVTGISASVVGTDLIIAHDNFEQGTIYTVNIPAGAIVDYADPISWTFTTVLDEGDFPNPHTLAVNVNGSTATLTWSHGGGAGGDDTPYFEGFEGTTGGGFGDGDTQPASTMPEGWTRTSEVAWGTTGNTVFGVTSGGSTPATIVPRTGTRQLNRSWANTGGFTWTFSNGINLTGGTTYTISFWYRAPGYPQFNEFDMFKVQIGTTTDRTGSGASATMTGATTVFSNTNQRVTEWTQVTFNFTPTTSGEYFLGFHDMTPQEEGLYITIDDISIESQGKASEEELAGFNIFLDGNLFDAVSATTMQYVFNDLAPGSYVAGVQAVGDGGSLSAIVPIAFEVTEVSVKPIDLSRITIYPNPVEDRLFISSTESVKRVEIYNLQGKLVKVVINSTQEIQVGDLKSGTYLIKITTDQGVTTQRFVKK